MNDCLHKIIELPEIDPHVPIESTSLLTALKQRRSCRSFDPHDNRLSLKDLGTILFAADGVTQRVDTADDLGHGTLPRHTAPSGGAVYPIKVYVFNEKVITSFIQC